MIKQKAQVAIGEVHNQNRVCVKVNGHPAFALLDLQTIAGDLNSTEFMYLYELLVVKFESETLATGIKESNGIVDKACEVDLYGGRYEWTRMFHVVHSLAWNLIIRNPALLHIRATISVGTAPVAIQPAGRDRFSLRMWRRNHITDDRSEFATAVNCMLACLDKLAV